MHPKDALNKLIDGNKCFMENAPRKKSYCFNEMKKSIIDGQRPYAIVLGCSDSRVSPEIVFDTGLGELFVVRTAGNTIGPNILESIEYAVSHLKIKLLVILGHQDCGVMKYAMSASMYNDPFENLIYQVQAAKVQDNISCPNDLAKCHCEMAKKRLLAKSNIIKEAYEKKELTIVKAYFKLENGEVEMLED